MQGVPTSYPTRFSVSTLDVPAVDRISFWEAVNVDAFAGARCSTFDQRGLIADAATIHTDRLTISNIRGNEHIIERSPQFVRSAPKDSIFACLLLKGNAFFYQDGKCINLAEGDLIIYDTESPFLYGFPADMQELLIDLPRRDFLRSLNIVDKLRPMHVDHSVGLGKTICAAVKRTAFRVMEDGAEDHKARLHELVSSIITGSKSKRSEIMLLLEAKSIIAENLTNHDLNATFTGQRMRLSVRHLNRLFEAEDTSVGRYIRTERLKRARRDLGRSDFATIGEIAHRWGFSDISSFSRAFRREFGVTATDVRKSNAQSG